jgi:hypothetical protein
VGWVALTLASLSLLWVVQRRAVNRSGATLCGSCGYNLQGLAGHTCPECGGDLRRRDGVLRPGWPYATERLARLVQWTVLLPIAGLTVTGLLSLFLQRAEALRFLALSSLRDKGLSVNIRAAGKGYLRPVSMDRVDVELLAPPSASLNVEVGPKSLEYRMPDLPHPWSGQEVDRQAVASWMTRLGLDGTSADALADAEELASLIRSAARDRDWGPAPTRFRIRDVRTSSRPMPRDPWFRIAAAGLWTSVWLAGVVRILTHRPASRRRA